MLVLVAAGGRPYHVTWRLTTLAVLLVALRLVATKPGYLLTTPNTVIPGSKHNICISLSDFTSDVTVYYEINKNVSTQIYGGGTSTLPAEGGCYELEVSMTIPHDEVQLYVELRESEYMENYIFKGSTMLSVLRKVPQFTIIQTDKPVYMPHQTVRIRLLTLRYDLTPVRSGVQHVSIQNPMGFDIERWENVSLSTGIVELNMTLAAQPVYGTYTILCRLRGAVERVNFKVLKYVLPRIELIYNHPEYFNREADNITGEICSRYTFAGDRLLPTEKLQLRMKMFVVKVYNDSYAAQSADPFFTINSEMRGCYRYHVPSERLSTVWDRDDVEDLRLLVRANVTEYGTGIQTIGRDAFIKLDTLTLTLGIVGEDTYMPGLPYEFKVRLQHKNRTSNHHRNVSVEVTGARSTPVYIFAETNDDGYAFFSTTIRLNTRAVTIQASLRDEKPSIWSQRKSITSWFSPSGRYLKLRLPNDGSALRCDRSVTVEFYYTTTSKGEIIRLNTQVISVSKIVMSKSELKSMQPQEVIKDLGHPISESSETCTNNSDTQALARGFRGIGSTTFRVTHDMSPSSILLIFYISPGGEVVSDVLQISITECTSNPVKLSFNKNVVQPGRNIYMEISAAAESLCAFGVIDRSVNLVENNEALNISQVFTKLKALYSENNSWDQQIKKYRDYEGLCKSLEGRRDISGISYGDLVDATYSFLIGKTTILTDLQVTTRQSYCCQRSSNTNGIPQNNPIDASEETFDGNKYIPSVNVRHYFPETWLWDAVIVNRSGVAIVPASAPHSMTSWEGRAMCVHDSRGFGLSPVATITTFQRFFIRVRLPYSAIRGESVPVVVKIHNYFSECFMITVSIMKSENFTTEREETADVCVCGSRTVVHVFAITPRAIGNINVTVNANQMDASKNVNTCPTSANMSRIIGVRDAVLKTILVELEGQRQEHVHTFYVCGRSELDTTLKLPLNPAVESVPDSARGTVSVVGDILGHTIGNLKTLVVLPVGCGEQRMRGFASTVFSLEYLEATGRLSFGVRSQGIDAIKEGYQQQLGHRCANGAFAFYTNSYAQCPSNVWLTAFIVKCFAHAEHYVSFTVQDLQRSIAFINASQSLDGCFEQIGHGAGYNLAAVISDPSPEKLRMRLTAFTAISLLEAGVKKQDIVLLRAFSCLDRTQASDIYGHALKTYALSLHEVGSQRHQEALKILWEKATHTGRNNFGNSDYLVHWNGSTDSMSVEATSYAILALLKQPDIPSILPAVKWLTTKRNANGGFISTQDTVVAVQALSSFATASYATSSKSNLTVKVATQGWEKIFKIKEEDLSVQTSDILQLRPENLTFQVQGQGCSVVQTNISYNVKSLTKSYGYFETIVTPFSPQVSESVDNCTLRHLHICTKYLGKEGNASNMAIIQIKMVSGWTADKNSLDALTANDSLHIAYYETDHGVLSLHFNQIPNYHECFLLYLRRTDHFYNVSAGYVSTYEYYTHSRRHDTNFTIEECSTPYTEFLITEEDDEDVDPTVDPNDCPTCFQPDTLSYLCQHRHVLKAKLRLSSINDKIILINGDLKRNNTFFQPQEGTPFIQPHCQCDPLDLLDASKSFVIAYARQLPRGRTNVGLYLSDKRIFIFECKRDLEIRIARQLQQCVIAP